MTLGLRKFIIQYINSATILAADTIISTLSSIIVLCLYTMLSQTLNKYATPSFIFLYILTSAATSCLSFYIIKTYHIIIRHSTMRDMPRFTLAIAIRMILFYILMLALKRNTNANILACLIITDTCFTFTILIIARAAMVYAYDKLRRNTAGQSQHMRFLVYGTSDKSVAATKRFSGSQNYNIEGYLTDENSLKNYAIENKPIFNFETEGNIKYLCSKHNIQGIIFPSDSDVRHEKDRLIQYCIDLGLKSLVIPAINDTTEQNIKANIRQIKIEDLLGRDEIKISLDKISQDFKDKVIMVTGAAGSIGSELCRQLTRFNVRQIIFFDNAETPMHNLRLEFDEKYPNVSYVPVIGDIRSKTRIDFAFRNYHPQIVFHAAAYKHVPLMEENPCEAVRVNVTGSHYIANKCVEYGVEKMVMISTDKAVNPTNIMGCSKRLAEIYVQSLAKAIIDGRVKGNTQFITTRFGNVLGSNGSVIPRFREQIEKGGPITVTHPDITRFFMTIPEACRLVMEAASIGEVNKIMVFEMGESVKIDNLARNMIQLSGLTIDKDIKIKYTGLRPGEKLYEEVLASTENTLPTKHERIRIAQVREYDYDFVHATINQLTELAIEVKIPEMVQLMKKTVPEFISKNSIFEEFDKKD